MPQDHTTIDIRQLENAAFLPHVVALIHEGHTVTLPLRGRSMRPFLEDGRDKALLARADSVSVGDVVLAELHRGHYVLHRVTQRDGDHLTLTGDGNLSDEHCLLSDVRAKAIAFYRKGRLQADTVSGVKWRLYSRLWVALRPLRRYLLFALHPHIPTRFRKQIV